MPRFIFLFAVTLLMAGCSTGPKKFVGPDDSAPVWDLNPGKWPGTNDLLHEPTLHPMEAANAGVGY
jgi:hypothetical protein